ncbi:MAG: hypothetical protein V2J25_11065 [Desulfatiglans sp.]|jgi:hypothetical protein|nr:hypothetical protein [Thermodesulfobacteriota bacterium]MEE4353397.1 hypothetical protein [Desulfatiglans sp.]
MNRYWSAIPILVLVTLLSCSGDQAQFRKLADQLYAAKDWNGPLPPKTFKTDGCSICPDHDWVECCIEHDLAYWMGGTREERKEADIRLKECVGEKGHVISGHIMYWGVRIGGVWWLPTPFRWGFGWEYPQSGPPDKSY